jgi:selenocysteine lyase/cysteine desulfurase
MIYLNNAATSYPKPHDVIKAVMNYIENIPFHSSRAGLETEKEDIIYTCRQKLASLFHIEKPENIIFTSGATESLNLALFGLDLKGGHVIKQLLNIIPYYGH